MAALSQLLLACADKRPAPIEDHTAAHGVVRADERYTVLRGDTLFAIAFRYGLDFRRLAAANAIAPPYTIFPGQELLLAEAEPPAPAARARQQGPRAPAESAPSKTVTPEKPAPATAKTPPTRPSSAPSSDDGSAAADAPVSRWRWPAEGRVARGFDGTLHKGIDITGERGDEIRATAGGRVVYAGSGIAGYGLMLILRHNDEYLSAYGHNDALLVKEGDAVRAGQAIARRGSSGTDAVKLHFEIRRRGRPVDPIGLLPRR